MKIYSLFFVLGIDFSLTNHYNINVANQSGCSAVGSAPALGAGCREFEPLHSDQNKDHGFYSMVLFYLSLEFIFLLTVFTDRYTIIQMIKNVTVKISEKITSTIGSNGIHELRM